MKPVLNAIGLVVKDMSAAVGFYGQLGLRFSTEIESHRECVIVDGFTLMLDSEETIRSLYPEWERPSGGHRAGLAFEMDSVEAVDEKYQELVKAGSPSLREPWDAFWGQRYAVVLDPDGNPVDLYAPLKTEA